ncbi:putative 21.2 kDa protein [Verticillium dahliae VDG1]|nr:putative 21.2 kDa protein [Verticillium dahliae VDG1]
MADLNLQEIHDALVAIAYEAGKMILAANPSDIDQGTKLNSPTPFGAVDIVTEADQAVEKMVSTRLREAYPSVAFMGEETYKPGTRVGPEPTFIVDPIDGTTNFVHSFPAACISLGLAVDRVPEIGAGGIMASGNPGNWEPELDGRLYLAVRGAPSGQRELVEEFWAAMGNHRMDYSV